MGTGLVHCASVHICLSFVVNLSTDLAQFLLKYCIWVALLSLHCYWWLIMNIELWTLSLFIHHLTGQHKQWFCWGFHCFPPASTPFSLIIFHFSRLKDFIVYLDIFCIELPFLFLWQLFIVIGNKRANSFWAGKLQPEEELHMDSSLEKRITFITQKYKEGRFRKTPLGYKTKEELNKVILW